MLDTPMNLNSNLLWGLHFTSSIKVTCCLTHAVQTQGNVGNWKKKEGDKVCTLEQKM